MMTPPSSPSPCSILLLLLLFFIPLAPAAHDPLAHPTIHSVNASNTRGAFLGCPSVPADIAAFTFKVLLPNTTFSKEFVDCSDSSHVKGFSVDVFEAARSILHTDLPFMNVSYTCFNFESGASYSDMVNCLSLGSFDAVVGDVTISAARLQIASSTLPYINSGIVLLAPTAKQTRRLPGLLFRPFTVQTWCSICACALIAGFVLWLFEHSMHPEFQHGEQKLRILKALWFVATSLFFFKRHTIQNTLAKVVLAGWLGFVLVLGSAYIATMSAILTVHNLPPENLTISSLQSGNVKVGYQTSSVVKQYLTQTLHIPDTRLVGLNSKDAFEDALSRGPFQTGGVGVIVDEIPHVNLFLSGLPSSRCSYVIVGSKLTSQGWGFMFRIELENLATEFSRAILSLSENGQLLKLQTAAKLSDYRCPNILQSGQSGLISSQGPFLFISFMVLSCIGICFAATITRRLHIRSTWPRTSS